MGIVDDESCVDRPLAKMGSTAGFEAEIAPSSVSKMKVGTVVMPAMIVKAQVNHPGQAGAGGADRPASEGCAATLALWRRADLGVGVPDARAVPLSRFGH